MDPLSQALNDLAAGKKKREFSMTDYESIPVENRQKYVAATTQNYSKQPKQHEQINVEGELKAVEPVSPKVDQLKAIFAPQPQAPQPEAPMQPMAQTVKAISNQDRPVSDLDTMRDIRSEASRNVAGGLTDFWPALVPLAVEALAGRGQGQSLDISSKYIMDKVGEDKKDVQRLEDKLFELQKAKAKAKSSDKGSKRFQSVNIYDPNTNEVLKANFDTSTGQYFDPSGVPLNSDKIRAGFTVVPEEYDRRQEKQFQYGKGTRISPTTGGLTQIKGGQEVPVGAESQGKMNPKQEKDLTALVKNFTSTDVYKGTAKNLIALRNVDALLSEAMDSKNATAYNAARGQIARMAGEVGQMTEGDIQRTGGSAALRERARRFAQLEKTGVPLTPRDLVELRAVLEIYRKNAAMKTEAAIEGLEKDFVENYGGVPGAVRTKMQAYLPELPSQSARPKAPQQESVFKEVQGVLYRKVPGGWEEVE